ncbi:hypothetical protein D3C80_805970 [compost metagenome]
MPDALRDECLVRLAIRFAISHVLCPRAVFIEPGATNYSRFTWRTAGLLPGLATGAIGVEQRLR